MSFIRSCFNPRTHEECDNKINITIKILRCFNPRTHEECDFLKHSVCMGILDVSIHALTRSATPTILIEIPFGFSFNPRTHEECDYNRYLLIQHRISFNPRTHEECDYNGRLICYFTPCFNPRTHEECDKRYNRLCSKSDVSIHALTRSATYVLLCTPRHRHLFQSTHSRGVRRRAWAMSSDAKSVSIHALTRSATNTYNL